MFCVYFHQGQTQAEKCIREMAKLHVKLKVACWVSCDHSRRKMGEWDLCKGTDLELKCWDLKCLAIFCLIWLDKVEHQLRTYRDFFDLKREMIREHGARLFPNTIEECGCNIANWKREWRVKAENNSPVVLDRFFSCVSAGR